MTPGTAILASLIAGVVATSGLASLRRHAGWGSGTPPHFACFAAGVLTAASLLQFIREYLALGPRAPLTLLLILVPLFWPQPARVCAAAAP